MSKFSIPAILLILSSLSGCTKWSSENREIYTYMPPAAGPISDSAPLSGNIKGTMLGGKTYTLGGDVYVLPTDTLIIQSGVTVNVTNQAGIIVEGTFISIGTQASPNWLTVRGVTKNNTPNLSPAEDSAYTGLWKGILATSSCQLMVIKWTHIEFTGAAYGPTVAAAVGLKATNNYSVIFQNYNGCFVLEDSWFYGSTNDCVHIYNGRIDMMRNTFEKAGPSDGDCLNVAGGTTGTMAYNMFIGTASNGQRVSNKSIPVGAPQTNIVMYNSTFVNCGYLQIQVGHGGSISFEQGARGMYYNNVVVNCKYGYRVGVNPAPDTASLSYGNNYQYADSLAVADQFYPVGYLAKPQATDIPAPASFLPAGYSIGDPYDGSPAVQIDNPMFANYPLPVTGGIMLGGIRAIGNFNFHLQAGSPLIGRGNIEIQALVVVPIDPVYGATEITPPGKDLGCYQIDGTGNQH
jgi:hypothetical protein